MTFEMWHVTRDTWHMISDMSHVTPDMWHGTHGDVVNIMLKLLNYGCRKVEKWHGTCDTWHVTYDTWQVVLKSIIYPPRQTLNYLYTFKVFYHLRVNPVGSVPCAMVGHYKNIFLKPKNFIFFCFRSIYLCYNSLKK